MGQILIIDDDKAFLNVLATYVSDNYPALEIICRTDPIRALADIHAGLELLLLDLEMPGMDGAKVLQYARGKGVKKSRIIILSGRDAEYLHQVIPMGECLAVLNKYEARQREVLDMIFRSLQLKSESSPD